MRERCANGHLMTKDNTYVYGSRTLCMECRRKARRISAKRARERLKARKTRDSKFDY